MARRHSRIETELPADLREALNRLLLEGATYEEACAFCQERGHDISMSSMGRYGKRFFEAYQAVKQFEDQARVLTSGPGQGLSLEEATSKMLLQRVMAGLISGEVDVKEMPRVISDVAKLQAASVARERFKADVAAKARKAADKVEGLVRQAGLSDETVAKIRAGILGIAR